MPRLGLGAMTWGNPSGLSRYTPAKLAYGGAEGAEQEASAFQASLAAGVTLFDTERCTATARPSGDSVTWPWAPRR